MIQNAGALSDQELAALERFVVENDDLQKLEARIQRFNIFDALGIANVEIRHSNFLAFILDPAESHGQSQLFLRVVLMDLLKAAPQDHRPFSPIEIDRADLRGVVVRREWENIDLLITCEEPHFVVAIENKIDSAEHSDQLSRYRATIEQRFPAARKMYAFLTKDGTKPSRDEWVSYSYGKLYQVLQRVRSAYANSIGDDVLVFLDHYLRLLETRFMNDKGIDDLCARIYKNHRQAIDLIMERVKNPVSETLREVNSMVEEDGGRWKVFWCYSIYIDFAPSSWESWIPRIGTEDDDGMAWLSLRFYVENGALFFHLSLNRMKQIDRRAELVERLIGFFETNGFRKRQSNKIKDDWMQLSGREKLLDWGTGEPQPDELRKSVKAKLDDAYKKLEGIRAVIETAIGDVKV